MIVLFVAVSFVIECVDLMYQSFLSECVFFLKKNSFWPCCCGFFTFPWLWEIRFCSQMISGTASWLLGLDMVFK